jgi:NADP-dependent alcohol dehydrogenase
MNKFNFYNPVRVIFGKDRLAELDNYVPKDAKVLVLYGGGSVKKFGTLESVMKALGERKTGEFGGIEPNPKYETLMKAVSLVKAEGYDFLLAVGGGSVMDGTKFVSLASSFEGEAKDLLIDYKSHKKISKVLPLGTVVTLPATGSEMNSGGVVSFNGGKFPFNNQMIYPKFSFIDPTLTMSLPKTQVANGIVDAFIHTTEQYLTYPVDGRFQDRTSEGILKTLIEIGPITLENPEDYDARANLVWCATMALNGLIGAGVPQDWSSHMIGHELTALFGIDHGKSLAVVAPALWTVLKEQKHDKLLQFAERVWGINTGTESEKVEKAIEKTRNFFESLGVKTHLRDYGIAESDIDKVVEALTAHGMVKLSETRAVTPEVSREILNLAL